MVWIDYTFQDDLGVKKRTGEGRFGETLFIVLFLLLYYKHLYVKIS